MQFDPVKISKQRRTLGYSQDKLACMAKVSLRTVQRAERGEPLRGETVADLAAALDVTTSALLQAEIPTAETAAIGDNVITLHTATTGREVVDLLEGCALARVDCDVDPTPDNIALLKEAIIFLEASMPDPLDEEKLAWPNRSSLVQRLELIAAGTAIIKRLSEAGLCLFIGRRIEMALIPRYGDEGFYVGGNQRPEGVAAARLLISASPLPKLVVDAEVRWPVEVTYPKPFDDDFSDDVPF